MKGAAAVAAIVAAVGGIVAATATAVRLMWDVRDRRRRAEDERRPTLRTFTLREMRDEVRDEERRRARRDRPRPVSSPAVVLVQLVVLVAVVLWCWAWLMR
jgi:hypothetical protein